MGFGPKGEEEGDAEFRRRSGQRIELFRDGRFRRLAWQALPASFLEGLSNMAGVPMRMWRVVWRLT